MAAKPWTEQAIDRFFAVRESPTRGQCDQLALSVSGASAVRPVNIPGSLSYTVVCTKQQGQQHGASLVVSFRQPESALDEGNIELALLLHGSLVPSAVNCGIVSGSDPPLIIHTMPLLPGIACLEALICEVDMDPDEEAKHVRFVTHLARYDAPSLASFLAVGLSIPAKVANIQLQRYFARCLSSPRPTEPEARAEQQKGISNRLATLAASPSGAVPMSTLSELQTVLPVLYTGEYPQVLAHGDLSKTNILVDPDTYEITGIVDWSLAAVQPFGMELDCLYLMTGYMDLNGWHDYACRPRLLEAFWAEFWASAGIRDEGGSTRQRVRAIAEAAAKIGAVLRYAFDRNDDGSPSEVLSTSGTQLTMLVAWFGV
jgi:hypothetical protein